MISGAFRPQITRETSEAIRVARVCCILFMVSVHVWPGATRIVEADVHPLLHGFYVVVIDYLGRGSVPLLSTVSGVLLTLSAATRPSPFTLFIPKVWSLLVPMALWSAILMVLYGADALLTGDVSRFPTEVGDWVNTFFSVTEPPANIPLAFLRDVFVSAVIGMAVLALCRRSILAGIAFLLVVVIIETSTGGVFLLRPQILVFFALGIVLSLGGLTNTVPTWGIVIALLAIDVTLRQVWGKGGGDAAGFGLIMGYLNRAAMSLFMWRLAIAVVRSRGLLLRATKALEPHIFVIFCSHMITIGVVGAVAGSAGISVPDGIYPLVFLVQFPMIVAFGAGISTFGSRIAPIPLSILSGRREGPP